MKCASEKWKEVFVLNELSFETINELSFISVANCIILRGLSTSKILFALI